MVIRDGLISITISNPFPDVQEGVSEILIDPFLTAVSATYQLPGGFSSLRVGLAPDIRRKGVIYTALERPAGIIPHGHVVASLGGHVFFEGVLIRTSAQGRQFECTGYADWAGRWGMVTASGESVADGAKIARVAIQSVPWWQHGVSIPMNVQFPWSDFQNRKANDVLQQLCTSGGHPTVGGPAYPWMFTVYEQRIARFMPMIPPSLQGAQPDHLLSFDPAMMDITLDFDRMIDAAAIVYTNQFDETVPSRTYFQPDIDRNQQTNPYLKRELLTGSGSDAAALAMVQTYLESNRRAAYSGTIRIPDFEGINMFAGETIGLEGLGDLDDPGEEFITQVQHDYTSGDSTISVGDPSSRTLRGAMRDLLYLNRAVRGGSHPVTWGRQGVLSSQVRNG